MNKHSFFSHTSRTALLVGKLILIIAAFILTANVSRAQSPVDLRVFAESFPSPVTLDSGQEIKFISYVFIESKRQASGAILTVEIPANVTISSIKPDKGVCSYSDTLITCNLGVVGREGAMAIDWVASVLISLKPTAAGAVTLTARITANEPDPNLDNNTITVTANVIKRNKRVRVF